MLSGKVSFVFMGFHNPMDRFLLGPIDGSAEGSIHRLPPCGISAAVAAAVPFLFVPNTDLFKHYFVKSMIALQKDDPLGPIFGWNHAHNGVSKK